MQTKRIRLAPGKQNPHHVYQAHGSRAVVGQWSGSGRAVVRQWSGSGRAVFLARIGPYTVLRTRSST
eukprot:5020036-Lingulodinium_polyedra.AAC.1